MAKFGSTIKYKDYDDFLKTAPLKRKKFNEGQKAIIETTISFLNFVHYNYVFVRLMMYFLTKSNCQLSDQVISALCERTDRQVRKVKTREAEEYVDSILHTYHNNRGKEPKVSSSLIGPIVEFIIENQTTDRSRISAFLKEHYGIEASYYQINSALERHGLKEFVQRFDSSKKSLFPLARVVLLGLGFCSLWLSLWFIG